jgi:hypothetical protein
MGAVATALAPSSGEREADVAAQFAPVRGIGIAVSDTGTVRYQLRSKVRGDEAGRIRVTALRVEPDYNENLLESSRLCTEAC